MWPFRRKTNTSESYSASLKNGWIVRFQYPDTDFDRALEAGKDHAMEYFAGMMGGLRVRHVEELRRLGFFDLVMARLGINVDVGSWEEIKAKDLTTLVNIIDEIIPEVGGMHNLLEDLREMAKGAQSEGCSLGFML